MKAGHWTSLYDALEDAATKDVHENKGVYSIEAVDSIEVTTSESKPAALQVLSETGIYEDTVKLPYVCGVCESFAN